MILFTQFITGVVQYYLLLSRMKTRLFYSIINSIIFVTSATIALNEKVILSDASKAGTFDLIKN